MTDIFGVVADATRRELLQVLLERYVAPDSATGDISVGELVEKLGLSQPTVSKHLKVLRDSGLVAVREVGQHRYYRLEPGPLDDIEEWIVPFLSVEALGGGRDPREAYGAFAAWSGVQMPAPLRRAGESLQHPGDAGTAVGRAVADATHGTRHRFEEASEAVERKVIDPLRKKLKKD